jgi:hypothetical protein
MSYMFPKTIFVDQPITVPQQFEHVLSEIGEISKAETAQDSIMECWDAIHSLETLIRKVVQHQHNMGNFINPHAIMLDVISKNQVRGYYE